MLFSGKDNHIAGLGISHRQIFCASSVTLIGVVGQMDEYLRGNRDFFKDKPGYEGYLNWKVAALSEILQDAGYQTMMSGKWHLGFSKDLAPCSRGFDKNFTFLPGAGNHYAWEPQLADG